jgi:hypothetical protein
MARAPDRGPDLAPQRAEEHRPIGGESDIEDGRERRPPQRGRLDEAREERRSGDVDPYETDRVAERDEVAGVPEPARQDARRAEQERECEAASPRPAGGAEPERGRRREHRIGKPRRLRRADEPERGGKERAATGVAVGAVFERERQRRREEGGEREIYVERRDETPDDGQRRRQERREPCRSRRRPQATCGRLDREREDEPCDDVRRGGEEVAAEGEDEERREDLPAVRVGGELPEAVEADEVPVWAKRTTAGRWYAMES